MGERPPEPFMCIKPACDAMGCCDCNCAISGAQMRRYAIRYAYLRSRPLDAVHAGGVFAGRTPDNVVLNGEDLDAAVDAGLTPSTEQD